LIRGHTNVSEVYRPDHFQNTNDQDIKPNLLVFPCDYEMRTSSQNMGTYEVSSEYLTSRSSMIQKDLQVNIIHFFFFPVPVCAITASGCLVAPWFPWIVLVPCAGV
jgi:hypothetical protein